MFWQACGLGLALYEHRRDLPDRLREAANELVDYLLFIDEPSLGGKPVNPASCT
jgi:hypothetical protein